jgi:hypothetical protein
MRARGVRSRSHQGATGEVDRQETQGQRDRRRAHQESGGLLPRSFDRPEKRLACEKRCEAAGEEVENLAAPVHAVPDFPDRASGIDGPDVTFHCSPDDAQGS